jgi:hypothetical protein
VTVEDMSVSDGEWHHVRVTRYGSRVTLALDGGEGALTARSEVDDGAYREIVVACDQIFLGAKVDPFGSADVLISHDFADGQP